MGLKLEIPEEDWHRLLHERTPKSNGRQASDSPVVPDLLPVGQMNKASEDKTDEKTEEEKKKNKETMAGLAEEVEKISQKVVFRHPDQKYMASAYRALILDLGKAATECSDLKTYVRISLFLFLAVDDLCLKMRSSSEERKQMQAIGRIYLRNYVVLALLGESLSALGNVQKKEEPSS
ncbi:hypothetical protein N0V85_003748 [Neurospora sp. IMI 360204]|nr:hypothetical protein N0V85_003748 [Neurospora sp. IMI 360204]